MLLYIIIYTSIVNYGDSLYQIAIKLATELIASLRWVYGMVDIPSGNLTSLWTITIKVVNCPMKNGWIFHSYVNVYQRV